MASGLGQLHGLESSPDFPSGTMDYDALEGVFQVGQSASASPGPSTGMVTMGGATNGTGSVGTPANRAANWSNLLDWRSGPLFWLMLATLGYLGLISLHVSAGIGRRR